MLIAYGKLRVLVSATFDFGKKVSELLMASQLSSPVKSSAILAKIVTTGI
jgi:hypothetical protein